MRAVRCPTRLTHAVDVMDVDTLGLSVHVARDSPEPFDPPSMDDRDMLVFDIAVPLLAIPAPDHDVAPAPEAQVCGMRLHSHST